MDDKLRLQDLDLLFKEEVAREPGCGHLLRCFSCGACTATCPVSEITPEFSPSLIIRQILYGQRAALLSSPALWYCARCARCSFQCPQDVRFLDIIQGLRAIALREGLISAAKAELLARGEGLIQELRAKMIERILAEGGEDTDPQEVIWSLTKKMDEQ
ncbi:MAG: 4Fe-4S dicluster domain-containing protein [Syntrophales bacterium]|nr:4Fe-4S dicluster domain-containing protein [Syntrophales bacterium]MDD5641732.1 4Fe-4S dicluster domain-containing protein [Syntrophales bacterium]